MNCVAIFGVGLIGGSFALALRKSGFNGSILGVSSPSTLEIALERGIVDRGVTATEAIEIADWIYLAQPISAILETIAAIGPRLRPGTLITDAGSTKKRISDQALKCIPRAFYIGGHPMAGKERSGVEHADANLFQGRPYVLSPVRSGDLENCQFIELRDWIQRMGGRPVILDADEHDRIVAFTSHLPQLLSTALAAVLERVEGASAVSGPGVLELTRLALSPFSIWHDILTTNDKHIEEALSSCIAMLQQMRTKIASAALEAEFASAARAASDLRKEAQK